jgi:alkylated DNA repair dioxygenase AlkB
MPGKRVYDTVRIQAIKRLILIMPQLNFLDDIGAPKDLSTDIFDYRPGIFSASESKYLINKLITETPWGQTSLILYGKEVATPRLTAWYGDAGIKADDKTAPHSWTGELMMIKKRIEPLAGVTFNGVLLNYYRDGRDSVSWHDDEDRVPGKNRIVASVSFGEARMFDIRNKKDHTNKMSILLEDGSYMLMKGNFQSQWQHRIAKSTKPMGPRVNLTFRMVKV